MFQIAHLIALTIYLFQKETTMRSRDKACIPYCRSTPMVQPVKDVSCRRGDSCVLDPQISFVSPFAPGA
jgi:hypothetical protein